MSRKRIVAVTGGGSGIGRATAKRFAEDGDFVVVGDINEESGEGGRDGNRGRGRRRNPHRGWT